MTNWRRHFVLDDVALVTSTDNEPSRSWQKEKGGTHIHSKGLKVGNWFTGWIHWGLIDSESGGLTKPLGQAPNQEAGLCTRVLFMEK